MSWNFLGMVVTLDITVIVIHILAITLLVRLKLNNVKGIQKILLIALCITELTYALIDIFDHICYQLELDPRTCFFCTKLDNSDFYVYIYHDMYRS